MLRPSPTKLLAMLCLFCLLAGAMTRCTSRPVPPYVATEPRNEAIYAIVGGWHTELALPMPTISGRLAALKLGFDYSSCPTAAVRGTGQDRLNWVTVGPPQGPARTARSCPVQDIQPWPESIGMCKRRTGAAPCVR
jgi:hypothetical protein